MKSIPTLEDFELFMGSFDDNTKLAYYQTLLAQTDYIAAKLAEATAAGTKVTEDYSAILAQRQDARTQINILRERLGIA